MGYETVERLRGYWRTQAGEKVPARVLAAEFEAARSRGPAKTTARYTYEVAGRNYVSDRISVLAPTGGYYPMLSEALRSGRTIEVFFDPKNPAFSTIDRTWSWDRVVFDLPVSVFLFVAGCFLTREIWRVMRDRDAVTPAYYFHLGRS